MLQIPFLISDLFDILNVAHKSMIIFKRYRYFPNLIIVMLLTFGKRFAGSSCDVESTKEIRD